MSPTTFLYINPYCDNLMHIKAWRVCILFDTKLGFTNEATIYKRKSLKKWYVTGSCCSFVYWASCVDGTVYFGSVRVEPVLTRWPHVVILAQKKKMPRHLFRPPFYQQQKFIFPININIFWDERVKKKRDKRCPAREYRKREKNV